MDSFLGANVWICFYFRNNIFLVLFFSIEVAFLRFSSMKMILRWEVNEKWLRWKWAIFGVCASVSVTIKLRKWKFFCVVEVFVSPTIFRCEFKTPESFQCSKIKTVDMRISTNKNCFILLCLCLCSRLWSTFQNGLHFVNRDNFTRFQRGFLQVMIKKSNSAAETDNDVESTNNGRDS